MRLRVLLTSILILTGLNSYAPAADFAAVGQAVADDLALAKMESAQRRQEIAQKAADLESRLQRLRSLRDEEEKGFIAAEAELQQARDSVVKLEGQITDRAHDMGSLKALFRDQARNLSALLEKSPASVDHPENLEMLEAYLKQDFALGPEEAETIFNLYLSDIRNSGVISRRKGPVINRQGLEAEADILVLGNIGAFYSLDGEAGYLTLSPASGRLLMSPPPPWKVRKNLHEFAAGETDAIYLDISGGTVITRLNDGTSFRDMINSGGVIVWPILAAGLAAVFLILERLLFFSRVRKNTDGLMNRVAELLSQGDYPAALKAALTMKGRPTGNVLLAGLEQHDQPRDVMESRMSEAILKEIPRLERFLATLKVLAASAPLMGLLGTVTGMINTFRVITQHGAGDPRLMAGGISEALITTQMGLIVAIPIMIVVALLSRRSQNLASDMEEKALAVMAILLQKRDKE
ncbi:MAG: MotA/TolQ/ExbB proton channel family protein [Pseudomonadota bacterium]